MMATSRIIRSYSELIKFPTFLDRFRYLKLDGRVGEETFGFDRYLNQSFYHSDEWRPIRDRVITRDLGCDLGIDGYEIHGRIYIHHMNPITSEDIKNESIYLYDPEYLICTSFGTHNAIHYGDEKQLFLGVTERKPNDTCPWKIGG